MPTHYRRRPPALSRDAQIDDLDEPFQPRVPEPSRQPTAASMPIRGSDQPGRGQPPTEPAPALPAPGSWLSAWLSAPPPEPAPGALARRLPASEPAGPPAVVRPETPTPTPASPIPFLPIRPAFSPEAAAVPRGLPLFGRLGGQLGGGIGVPGALKGTPETPDPSALLALLAALLGRTRA